MGQSVVKKAFYLRVLFIFLSSLSLVLYIIFILNLPSAQVDNTLRIKLNEGIYKAEQGDFSVIKNHSYVIYDLKGNIIKTNSKDYEEKLPLSSLSGTESSSFQNGFSFKAPFLKNEEQVGTILISVPKSEVEGRSSIYLILPTIILMFIFLQLYSLLKLLKRDVLSPIEEIHLATKGILKGELATSVSYDYDGEIGTLCHDFEGLRMDLAYRMENEKKLKEKEKLLLACISHDLKTPLSSISGYVEGLSSGLIKDEKEIKEYTKIILNKISMLNSLINDILTHSKAKLNQFTISLEEFYSMEFFKEVLENEKRDAIEHNRIFSYETPPNVLIYIDVLRIGQVMENLLSNAIKFTKEKGEINVSFSLIEGFLLVSVRDNGVGIKASDQPLIFNEFFRGEKARTLNVQGSGLGLSITKYIVEAHGGQIECDSILDFGTTITFSLPLA
ncbi:MAG: HAMP domain-containing sensor histidine kinase [Clostridium sp.]